MDTLAECDLQVLHEVKHTLLVFLREVLLYIHYAYGFAQGTIHHGYRAFPERGRLLATAEGATIELKVLHENLLGEEVGAAIYDLPCEEGLHVLERLLLEHFACLLQVADLTY